MKIGELAKRANTSTRLLRYYEQQGLLTAGRAANGYREYAEALVDRVAQIRGLLDAGLPTRIIKQIIPCLNEPRVILFSDATPEMIVTLEREREHLEARIHCLARNRDAIASYLDALRACASSDLPAQDPQNEKVLITGGSPQAAASPREGMRSGTLVPSV